MIYNSKEMRLENSDRVMKRRSLKGKFQRVKFQTSD